MSHKSSTALQNVSTGADLVGFATLQGVDPVSPANLLDARTSTRPSFARYEFCETRGLVWCNRNSLYTYRSDLSALSRRRRSLGLLALATYANADRSKKRAARRARWHEHPGCVRFSHKGLQARAAKSSLARPFMARSYVPSYFCYTTLVYRK